MSWVALGDFSSIFFRNFVHQRHGSQIGHIPFWIQNGGTCPSKQKSEFWCYSFFLSHKSWSGEKVNNRTCFCNLLEKLWRGWRVNVTEYVEWFWCLCDYARVTWLGVGASAFHFHTTLQTCLAGPCTPLLSNKLSWIGFVTVTIASLQAKKHVTGVELSCHVIFWGHLVT